ncbi:MAG: GC-type dockerin domain-anchored protein [Planctomycetota bacterium]|nr:GC-type dockerin domain-anchored protein [Planctomycetota bacterium]
MLPSISLAQTCETFPEDALFVVRVEYFYEDTFGNGRTEGGVGPFIDQWPAQNRVFGNLSTIGRRSTSSGAIGERTLSYELNNQVYVNALRTAGNLYGGGQRAVVDVYVRHRTPGAGQPYWVEWTTNGVLIANHPAGAGTAASFFAAGSIASNNGEGQRVREVDDTYAATGLTSGPELDGHPGYFYARSIDLRTAGNVWQSIDFCPFCPPTVHQYLATVDGQGVIRAGPGAAPRCDGSLSVSFDGPCSASAVPGNDAQVTITRPFTLRASMSEECGCCEVRYFVRRAEVWAEKCYVGLCFDVPRGNLPPNCDGNRRDTECFVEDSSNVEPGFEGTCIRNGHRSDVVSRAACDDGLPNDLYGADPLDRANACSYRACDEPSFTTERGASFRINTEFAAFLIDTCSPGQPVVDERRWSACCTGVAGESVSVCGSSAGPDRYPRVIGSDVFVAGRRVRLGFLQVDGQLLVTAAVPTARVEVLPPAAIDLSVDGLPPRERTAPLTALDRTQSSIRVTSFFDQAFVTPTCFPRSVTGTLRLLGEEVAFHQDLAGIAPPNRGDFDGNGQVDLFDYLAFVAAFAVEDPSADFDGSGQVDLFDYLDFAAAFASSC